MNARGRKLLVIQKKTLVMPAIVSLWLARMCVAIVGICCLKSFAENGPASFDVANKLYEQGKYSEAAAAYQTVIDGGQRSAAVFFNLGNAYFKSGQTGRAIAAYRAAERLSPRDPDVRANLQFARQQTQGPAQLPDRWVRWLGKLTVNEWTLMLTVAAWLSLLLLAVLQWRPKWKPILRGYILIAGAGTVLLGMCLGTSFYESRGQYAIVITRDASVRNGPLEESQAAFIAHDGAELRVVDRKEDWLQVSAGPSRTGWLRREQVIVAPAELPQSSAIKPLRKT